MPHYLIQVAYTPESWAAMSKNPQDRAALIRPAVEALGGRVESFYFSFGDYDVTAIAQFPTNVDAGAFAISATAGGGVRAYKTTPLFDAEESMEAMRRSAMTGYAPPG